MVAVPDVRGQDQARACATLRAARLECRPVASGQVGGGPVGSVVATDPTPGTEVQERYIVEVRYRDRAQVPDLVGKTATAACAELVGLGLTCTQVVEGLATTAAGLNTVTRQSPSSGERIDSGAAVTIAFPDKITVPSVAGIPYPDACTQLSALGFTACTPTDAGLAPAGQAAGSVIGQAPEAGTGAGPNDPITLQYYGGVQVTVPNLIGLSPADAAAQLSNLGLAPAPTSDEVTSQPNVVHAQSVAAGSAVAPGTAVGYVYEDAPLVPLYLHKRSGEPYYLLSTDASVPGYTFNRALGNVFPASTPGGGTTAVYRYRCDNACGPGTTYYFSMTNVASTAPAWVNDGVAFYAYAQGPAGAAQVDAMFDRPDSSWVWAVNPSGPYSEYAARGYTSNNFVLGYIWP
ncbi:PASTA domain-containing protein [Frankia sp. EI5c]